MPRILIITEFFVNTNVKKEVNTMRTKLNITEGIFPMPVLMIATYNEDGTVNVMNAAWGTMQERNMVALNLTESHKTVKNIKNKGAFTVSIADAAHVVEADYFGVESGNRVGDKFARSGLTASKAETVDAPVINEFPLCLECEFIEYQHNEYYYKSRYKKCQGKLYIFHINFTAFLFFISMHKQRHPSQL